ncbi:NAD(P)-dependent oxidoreductase [Altericroceibacterium spongiae]|uniref:NAD(P)-dependent oxidoreductase n=2 Tax=Altericroceibacterium spongiae TaxID=2320269 RepID=A0A420ELZ2_9SPHN|nr:NAD(P)-dependent oxidoreductase [Altericroceibacterium spongiae]
MKTGFCGLGNMGEAMAATLVAAGFDVTVWNRSPEPVQALAEKGATSADTVQQAAENADILIAMLPDDTVTRQVLVESGALDALPEGAVFINMATVSIAFSRELDEFLAGKGLHYLAAPVLGRPDVAAAGALNILAAGRQDALDTAMPVLEAMGSKVWHFGDEPQQANAVKLAVNAMIAGAIGMMGESVALAQGYGIDRGQFIELISTTLFASPVYQGYGRAIAEERYEPAGFKLSLGLKDVRLALEAGERVNVPQPISAILRDALIDALAHHQGDQDWASLARVATRRAGQE